MARRGFSLLYAAGLFLSDLTAVSAAFIFVFWLRFHCPWNLLPAPTEIPPFIKYLPTLPFVCLVIILSLRGGGLYRESLSFSKEVRIGSIVKYVFQAILILLALSALYREISFSRLFGLLLFPVICLFVFLGRLLLNSAENMVRRMQGKKKGIIVVGENSEVMNKLVEFIIKNLPFMYHLLGIVSINGNDERRESASPYLGTLDQLDSILDQHQPDEVIFSTVNLDHSKLTDIVTACDRRMIQFYIVPDIFDLLTSKVEVTSLAGINLLGLKPLPLDNGLNRLLKRLMDITGSLAGIFIFSVPMMILACIIKTTSRGPVFFNQIRCNEDGKEFIMYKFRTMSEFAEKETGPVFAKEADTRCTKIGLFMRSRNMDELPQLFNVLKGDMSLIGPRPERPHFISKFKWDIPRYMSRHRIKPGITGWAQIHGWRGNTSLEERIKHDLYYIENWNLWLDFKILFFTVFSFKNAY
ncbi:MAG: exopolysaccharide biosynthesis polyprenyl glycosylphosphotransferase [Candidatus Aureabacteria bacterium]|nr:exopolysaccharide biosynthesis polyprenyl glycosylphosphotransferase [Candidatus Auribacterota bacterium]